MNTAQPDGAEADKYSPLNLAYVGDAVFSLLVRSEIAARGNMPVGRQNEQAKGLVRAGAQAAMYHAMLPLLTAEEEAVLKRGRNAKAMSRAKHASMSDYRHATAVEALFGYLYLKGCNGRVLELFAACRDGGGEEKGRL